VNCSLLHYKKVISIFFIFLFVLYNIYNIFNHLVEENSLFKLPIQNIQGQLQQQQTDYVKHEYQSDFIKEFEIPIINNEIGLKGITTDSENNVWFYHNTNTSSAIIEFNPVKKNIYQISNC